MFVDCYAQVQGKVVPEEVHEAASMKTAEAGASVADFYRRHHGACLHTMKYSRAFAPPLGVQSRHIACNLALFAACDDGCWQEVVKRRRRRRRR